MSSLPPPSDGRSESVGSTTLFTDRDLSLLRFQARLLDEALDARHPVLERVRFLAIVATNIDDFVMIRGPRLRKDPARRLVVEAMVYRLLRDGHLAWRRVLVPALRRAGIQIVRYRRLTTSQRADVDSFVRDHLLPHVVPMPWSPAAGAPPVPSLGSNLLVSARTADRPERLTVVHLPDTLSPLIRCPSDVPATAGRDERCYVWLDEAMIANMRSLFPDATQMSTYQFRVLRDADVGPAGPGDDPVEHARQAAARRDTNPVVSLVLDRRMPAALAGILCQGLDVPAHAVRTVSHVPGLRRTWEVSRISRSDLHVPEVVPRVPKAITDHADMFAAIRGGDLLLHHPFESFQPVVDFLQQAAHDPDVRSLSLSLYRTDRESPVGHSVIEAARHGKQVRVVVELGARFDEARNADWARRFQDAGIQVSFAPTGLKVHAKRALVVRHEGSRLRRYAHVSSGNYNAFTAKVYTDIGLLTCDDDVSADVEELFDVLTGRGGSVRGRRLIVAPLALRAEFERLVTREIDGVRRGEAGHIVLKMNALADRDVIALLYRAAQAGVRIDLLVRGICALRPGVPGVSDTITVRSVVGRYLEHSRVWWFRNGGHDEAFVGSADLLPRNLNRRIEVMARIVDAALVRRLRDDILGAYLADDRRVHRLRADGSYERAGDDGTPVFDVQAALHAAGRRQVHQ